MTEIKVLSIKQPWAWIILHPEYFITPKLIENRTWKTNYRGRLYIHASQNLDRDGYEWCTDHSLWRVIFSVNIFEYSEILGHVDLVNVVEESYSPWFFGPYGWVFENPTRIEPIPSKGKLGIWSHKI